MDINEHMNNLSENALFDKKKAQTMAAFLKTAKARKFVETGLAMKGETVSCFTGIYNCSTLGVHIRVNELEGMKDERLQGILNAFMFMEPEETRNSDYAAGLQRTFNFYWNIRADDAPSLRVWVAVEAQVKDTSETCKKVVVGYTDGKPQPIYKLECSDQENAPAREAPADQEQM